METEIISTYKKRDSLFPLLFVSVGSFLILIFLSAVKYLILTRLPLSIPIEVLNIFDFGISLFALIGATFIAIYVAIRLIHSRSKVPFKYEVINSFHELLAAEGFIASDDQNWERNVSLRVKKIDKDKFVLRFRIVGSKKATKEYFEKMYIWRTGTFANCVADSIEFDSPYFEWTLVFGDEPYE